MPNELPMKKLQAIRLISKFDQHVIFIQSKYPPMYDGSQLSILQNIFPSLHISSLVHLKISSPLSLTHRNLGVAVMNPKLYIKRHPQLLIKALSTKSSPQYIPNPPALSIASSYCINSNLDFSICLFYSTSCYVYLFVDSASSPHYYYLPQSGN